MPPYDHPDRKKIQGSIERQGKNAGIQGSNADTIKEAMTILVERLKPYDAKLILTVHDEVVVEVKEEQKYEVAPVVAQSLVDGFGKFFSTIPMKTDTLIGPCWMKDSCENKVDDQECGCTEMKFKPHPKMGSKLVCTKCGKEQD
jgi:DNA polymerase I-like protein with 3'-5' exonuclease and polymerase domains